MQPSWAREWDGGRAASCNYVHTWCGDIRLDVKVVDARSTAAKLRNTRQCRAHSLCGGRDRDCIVCSARTANAKAASRISRGYHNGNTVGTDNLVYRL